MQKQDEIKDPNSCWNKAKPTEKLFILLDRDKAAPNTVRDWCRRRCTMGLNNQFDPQISEALNWADDVEKEQTIKELN